MLGWAAASCCRGPSKMPGGRGLSQMIINSWRSSGQGSTASSYHIAVGKKCSKPATWSRQRNSQAADAHAFHTGFTTEHSKSGCGKFRAPSFMQRGCQRLRIQDLLCFGLRSVESRRSRALSKATQEVPTNEGPRRSPK